MDYNRIDAILEDYRARGYYPDAVCHVFNEKETLHVSEIGRAKDNQYFDLASVSKIICTTMILTLVDEGKLTFNTKICELLPNLGEVSRERLKAVTVRMLMTHTSGIVPWYPFYADGRDFYVVLEHVLSTTPKEVGMAYSDLNFMLLGQIVMKLSGLTLREALKQYVKEPLGISEMFYGPMEPSLCVPSSYGNPIEERMCAERQITFNGWRDKSLPVCGECNDGNAHYYWHGASGHAGIFATAGALQKLCQFYMTTEKPAFLEAMNTSIFERGLGFDRSNVFPDGCGHSGFTGTSIWFSREHHIGAVILTNKFYRIEGEPPGNSNEFRRAVHYALIGKEPPVLA